MIVAKQVAYCNKHGKRQSGYSNPIESTLEFQALGEGIYGPYCIRCLIELAERTGGCTVWYKTEVDHADPR